MYIVALSVVALVLQWLVPSCCDPNHAVLQDGTRMDAPQDASKRTDVFW